MLSWIIGIGGNPITLPSETYMVGASLANPLVDAGVVYVDSTRENISPDIERKPSQ